MAKKLILLFSIIILSFSLLVIGLYYMLASGAGLSLYGCGEDLIKKVNHEKYQSYAAYRFNCRATTDFWIHIAFLKADQIGESICAYNGRQYVLGNENIAGDHIMSVELLVDGKMKTCLFPEE